MSLNYIMIAVAVALCLASLYQWWLEKSMSSVGALQHAVPRFTLAGCFFFIASYIAVVFYENGAYSDGVILASDILFIVGIFIDYAHLLYIIYLAISASRLLVDMTPSPDVILRDRIFLATIWVIMVVAAGTSVALCHARNDAAYLGIYLAFTAVMFVFLLAFIWRSIYQMNTFLSERSASGKSGSTASPMASFTRFMIAVTAAFVALCAALAWSSVLALTSFGQTAYLPRPVPLPFSFTSSLCLLVWCVGLWGTWKTPPLPAVGEAASSEAQPTLAAAAALQRRSTQQFKDKAAAVVETSTAATARDDGIALIVVGQSSSETAEPRQ